MKTCVEKMNGLGKQFAIFQMKMETQRDFSTMTTGQVIDQLHEEIGRIKGQCTIEINKNASSTSGVLLAAQQEFLEKIEGLKEGIGWGQTPSTRQQSKAVAANYDAFAAFAMNHANLAMDLAILAFYEAIDQLEKLDRKEYRQRRESTNDR